RHGQVEPLGAVARAGPQARTRDLRQGEAGPGPRGDPLQRGVALRRDRWRGEEHVPPAGRVRVLVDPRRGIRRRLVLLLLAHVLHDEGDEAERAQRSRGPQLVALQFADRSLDRAAEEIADARDERRTDGGADEVVEY